MRLNRFKAHDSHNVETHRTNQVSQITREIGCPGASGRLTIGLESFGPRP